MYMFEWKIEAVLHEILMFIFFSIGKRDLDRPVIVQIAEYYGGPLLKHLY